MLTVSQMLFQHMAFVLTMLIVGARADADECTVSAAKLTNSTDATILLIANDELADAWQPFARWKTAIGKQTKSFVRARGATVVIVDLSLSGQGNEDEKSSNGA